MDYSGLIWKPQVIFS